MEPLSTPSGAPAIDQEKVTQAIALLREAMPFLQGVTADDRRTMLKLGDKSQAFVTKSLELAHQNPDILPGSFDLSTLDQNYVAFTSLYPVSMALTQLLTLVDDTRLALGSQVYSSTLKIYNYAKMEGKATGLEPLLADLGQRFTRSKSLTAEGTAANASNEPLPIE